ncbi:MAG: hypothetical protein ACOCT7_01190 [Candidatus Saliniplasma sp.]
MMLDNLTASVTILLVTLIAGMIPSVQQFGFLPLMGGSISIVGLFLEKTDWMDGGLLFSMVSFLYIQRLAVFDFTNLIIVLVVFFLLFTTLIINRRALISTRIKKETAGDVKNDYLKEFELKSILSISYTVVTAFIVSLIGAVIAVNSSLGLELSPDQAVILVLVLAISFFAIIYAILEVIPKLSG